MSKSIALLGLALATAVLARPAAAQHAPATPDTAFARLQQRGQVAMGVDQYTSRHQFEALADGGRIELQRLEADSVGTATIRAHLQEIAGAFRSGDFATPAFVHWREVPGAAVMGELRGAIRYVYRDLPKGGELRISSADPRAVRAIHEFLRFQNSDHRSEH